jgi:hypothetical protein
MQALVVRENKVLMVKSPGAAGEVWGLPSSPLDPDNTPELEVLVLLQEAAGCAGVVIRQTSFVADPATGGTYTFHVEIGDQDPLQHDDKLGWLTLEELPERDRATLWAAGLLTLEPFRSEVTQWGAEISYPGK